MPCLITYWSGRGKLKTKEHVLTIKINYYIVIYKSLYKKENNSRGEQVIFKRDLSNMCKCFNSCSIIKQQLTLSKLKKFFKWQNLA